LESTPSPCWKQPAARRDKVKNGTPAGGHSQEKVEGVGRAYNEREAEKDVDRQMPQGYHKRHCHRIRERHDEVSSYVVMQLYCTPAEADAIRSVLTAKVAEFPEFANARIQLEQKAETDSEMHLDWAAQHPGQDAADRAYFLLEVTSATDIPEPILREVEDTVTDSINSTYNDNPDDIIEVPWGSYAGTTLSG
jgi:hypothetical protein